MATYPLTPGTLASNCWPVAPQTLYNEMFAKGAVTINIGSVIIQEAEPDPEDRDKLWIKTTAAGLPVRQFIFQNGLWVWPHEVDANSSFRTIWVGTTVALQTADGGSAGTVGDASGPFWEVDTDAAARFLMGAGTTSGSSTVVNVGDTGGSDQVTVEGVNVGSHYHGIGNLHNSNDDVGLIRKSWDLGSGADGEKFQFIYGDTDDFVTTTANTIGNAGTTENFQIEGSASPTPIDYLPPYYGVYLIKRTARIYRTS